jgi:hypothetical protein
MRRCGIELAERGVHVSRVTAGHVSLAMAASLFDLMALGGDFNQHKARVSALVSGDALLCVLDTPDERTGIAGLVPLMRQSNRCLLGLSIISRRMNFAT